MFLKSPWSSMGVTSTRVPVRGEGDRLRKERFLAKFKRDPLLVPIPFLEPGQSPSPVALGGPVCSAITTAFMTQAEEMLQDMKDLCHQQDTWHRRLVRLKRSGRRCVSRCVDLRSVVRGELESLEQELQCKKDELAQAWGQKRKCWRPLVLHLEYQSGLQGCPWVLQLSQVHPKRKEKEKQKHTLACPHKKGRNTISHTLCTCSTSTVWCYPL